MMRLTVFVIGGLLAGCQGMEPPILAGMPRTQPYVSAQNEDDLEADYGAALVEAMHESEDSQPTPDAPAADLPTPHTQVLEASGLWGTPPASLGTGVSLKDNAMRTRLNDALATTPINGKAQWEEAGLTYVFLPNSPVYLPHRSGGRCRDGVFAVYGDGFTHQRVRGLFCQSGPGADWLLIAAVEAE